MIVLYITHYIMRILLSYSVLNGIEKNEREYYFYSATCLTETHNNITIY